MKCIYCMGKTQVINSRPQKRLNHIWRRRKCSSCTSIFTTSEAPELDSSLLVQKSTTLEPFSRDKLFLSIYESCKHRQTALNDAQALTGTIISRLLRGAGSASIPVEQITLTAATVLNNFDKPAHTHYTAYHPL